MTVNLKELVATPAPRYNFVVATISLGNLLFLLPIKNEPKSSTLHPHPIAVFRLNAMMKIYFAVTHSN